MTPEQKMANASKVLSDLITTFNGETNGAVKAVVDRLTAVKRLTDSFSPNPQVQVKNNKAKAKK